MKIHIFILNFLFFKATDLAYFLMVSKLVILLSAKLR